MSASKILVIDDSATVRQLVGQALEIGGFDVIEAVDGQDGLDKIQSMPDLAMVICDINMPRKNGFEVLEAVGTQAGMPPILMLTTEGAPELMQRAKASGAKGWIVKPFKSELLLAAAQKITGA